MAFNSVLNRLVVRQAFQQVRHMGGDLGQIKPNAFHGNREVVGFGMNGGTFYVDRYDYPMPAIRFKENTPDIQVNIDIILSLISN